MYNKLIADIDRGNPNIKMVKNVKIDMLVETKGLLAVIYHHAKLYDDCLFANDEKEANIHYESFMILGRIFNATIEENFEIEDKVHLLDEAKKLCLRMMQEAKHEKLKTLAYALCRMFTNTSHRLTIEYLDKKNTPK